MNRLLADNISWDRTGIDEKKLDEAILELAEAVLDKDTGTLKIRVDLNFVVPREDDERLAKAIAEVVPGAGDLSLEYVYRKDEIIQERGDVLRLAVPRFVAESDMGVVNSSKLDSITVEADQVKVNALGEMATGELNRSCAAGISRRLSEELGVNAIITFVNDESRYDMAEKARAAFDQEEEKKEKEIMEKARAAQIQKKKETVREKDQSEKVNRTRRGNPFGKKVTGEPVQINTLVPESGEVTVNGTIFSVDERPISQDRVIVSLLITDKTSSGRLKAFLSARTWEETKGKYAEGTFVAATGKTEWNRFDNCLDILVSAVEKRQGNQREDMYPGNKRVELHAHTKMSDMDGLNDVEKLVRTAARWGQPAVAITDHGVVQAFPDAAAEASRLAGEGTPIQVIFGMEGYVFDDEGRVDDNGNIDYKGTKDDPVYTNHIILLARTQQGLQNIYKLVSLSHLDYFYRKPRLPKSVLAAHREGILIGSACEAGEVYSAVRRDLPEEEIEKTASFYDYLEIQPLINNRFMIEDERYETVTSLDDLKEINRRIIELGEKLGKPVVATTDAHYDEPESAIYRNIIMAGKGFKDAESGEGLYLRTTDEMLEEFSYLGEELAYQVVVENTNEIAKSIEEGIRPVPKEKFPPKIPGAEERLRESCMKRAHEIYGDILPEEIGERLTRELNSIIDNGYAVMYVSAQMLVDKSHEDGYLVGSRGSVGSSFAATMAGITEVNPLSPHYICPNCKRFEWGDMETYDCGIDMPEKDCPDCGTPMKRDGFTIPFATFLGFEGNKEPDIDLNFAGEYQARAHKYVGEIFGEENVFKAGTVSAIQDKTAFGFVRKFAEETGRQINEFETERLVKGCTGVKRTTGQHPGGIVIVPEDREIYEFCPVQRPANDAGSDITTTHFDYHKIEKNLLKLDILGHNVPSMIRHLQDMTGKAPMDIDLSDRKVLSIFNDVDALDIRDPGYKFTQGSYGIPEFGTGFVRQMLADTTPDKFADLVRISGFSHGTDVWLNNAQDYIRSGVASMREVISTRDDIMNYMILKGIENETAFHIMEDVRKNRPLKDEQLQIMKEHGVPDWYIDSCIKIKYMFPRAHAVAYTMMSFRMAWYKVYYPREYYAATFTSMVSDFEPDIVLAGPQACIDRLEEIYRMGKSEQKKEEGHMYVLESAYEMYARGFDFSDARFGESEAERFTVKEGRVVLPFAAFPGVGETAARAIETAYNERPFDTVEDVVARSGISRSVVEVLREHGVFEGMPETDQIAWNV